MRLKILWGTPVGEALLCETLMTDNQEITQNEERLERFKEIMKERGYDRFRIAIVDMDVPPYFIKSVGRFENEL